MDLFWSRGYEATGLRDLLEHMQIGRQSLYDTFGDKRSLFVEAVEHYRRRLNQDFVAELDGSGTPLERIRRAVSSMGDSVTDGQCRGCLITNTIIESAPHDQEIADAARSLLRGMENALRRVVKQAVAAGELPADTNDRALARFLTSTIQGLVVMGKASVTRSAVKDIVDGRAVGIGLSEVSYLGRNGPNGPKFALDDESAGRLPFWITQSNKGRKENLMTKPQEFTDANFQAEVLDSRQPVVVDFWAAWCGPCRAVGPTIDELAEQFDGAVKVGKLNIDDNQQTPAGFNINSIPAVLLYKDGQVVERLVGVQSKQHYEEALERLAA